MPKNGTIITTQSGQTSATAWIFDPGNPQGGGTERSVEIFGRLIPGQMIIMKEDDELTMYGQGTTGTGYVTGENKFHVTNNGGTGLEKEREYDLYNLDQATLDGTREFSVRENKVWIKTACSN
jgi:hypothetical protein